MCLPTLAFQLRGAVGAQTKDIIEYAQHLNNVTNMHEFEAFLASFEEWILK